MMNERKLKMGINQLKEFLILLKVTAGQKCRKDKVLIHHV